MIIVSNTSPINYLVLIEEIDLLPKLFTQIIIPNMVYKELSDPKAPNLVQTWINKPPNWLIIQPVDIISNEITELIDPGEHAAILLAEKLNADLLILDDMKARLVAKKRGLAITGLLGIIDQATTMKLINLPKTIEKLKNTSFFASEQLFQNLLDKYN